MNKYPTNLRIKKYSQSGFTLIELLVVMVIIGLLAALVVPKFFGHVDKAMQQDAQAQIELLGQALDLYRLENHKYPSTDEGLEKIALYLKKEVPKDPWGNNYTYTSPGEHGDYDLVSYGADSVEGGENNNKDIVSWK
ncbi:MAG: type II secretion system major pseudopilin GspG [Nitrospinaceae bacterium]|jgi:general secretion pathway protein G|nr:type II secretion system major pseudopilin GspG [Nitrospina sp.]MBT5258438.1 type II secretion system major pseudopilin GspG [Nitrospina sp.]MBT5968285.1 type II secretion system major pseudopilin GspG [Nitrospina sp.]MBT6295698.1 type II secretion system major pseudopilin GspG [Nitrospina sp.]MDG1844721.1 type II secretion system major pseudopilin GspG [Nitrospinaceae bacterium]